MTGGCFSWVELMIQASWCGSLLDFMKPEQKTLLKQKIITAASRDYCPTTECQRFYQESQQRVSHWEMQLKSPPRGVTLRTWMCSEQVFWRVLPTGSFMPGDSLTSILKPSKTRLASGRWENSIHRGEKYQLSQTNMLLYIFMFSMWKLFTMNGPIA